MHVIDIWRRTCPCTLITTSLCCSKLWKKKSVESEMQGHFYFTVSALFLPPALLLSSNVHSGRKTSASVSLCLRNTPASALLQSRLKLSLERCLLRFSFLLSILRQIAEEVAPGAALRHRSLAAEPVAVLYFLLICTAWACHCSSSETSELRHILKAHFQFGLKWLITSSKKTSHNRSVYWKSSNALLSPLPVSQTHVYQDPFFTLHTHTE